MPLTELNRLYSYMLFVPKDKVNSPSKENAVPAMCNDAPCVYGVFLKPPTTDQPATDPLTHRPLTTYPPTHRPLTHLSTD